MKTISHRHSRRNSARRKRKIEARHAGARRPRARWQPVFGGGKVHYEIGARINAMSYGGIDAMRRLASKLGLVREIDARLKVLKGLPPAGRLAGQHGRGALPGEPAGQRGEPPGRGGMDRPGGRPRVASCRAGVRARGHGLLADLPVRLNVNSAFHCAN